MVSEDAEDIEFDGPVDNSTLANTQQNTVSIGDEETFFASDTSTGSRYQTNATVEAVTPNATIYIEGGVDNNSNVDDEDINKIEAAFENTVRPELNGQFGTWQDYNNNGRLTILVLDIPAPRPGVIVGGYHFTADYVSQSTYGESNERDMVYMNEQFPIDGGQDFNKTLTQEVQHAINFNLAGANPTNTPETWLDEAVANYAEFEVYGATKSGVVSDYESNPDTTELAVWRQTLEDYGASFLYAMYLSEQYGDLAGNSGFMADIMQQSSSGTDAVDDTLADHGYDDRFEDTFRNWTVANHVDDTSVADEYGYTNLNVGVDTTTTTFDGSDQTVGGSVNETAAGYVEVTPNAESLYYSIENADIDPIVITETGSDEVVQTDLAADSESETTVDSAFETSSGEISSEAKQNSLPTIPGIGSDNTVTNADAYSSVTIILPRTATRTNYDVPLTSISDEHTFDGTLSADETASYVIPVNKYGVPRATSIYEWNNDVFTSVWSTGSGDINATLTDAHGNNVTDVRTPNGTETVERVGKSPVTESNVWRLDVNGTTADAPFRVATTYLEGGVDSNQVFTLPSDLEVSPENRNLQAGAYNATRPIRFTVNVSTAGRGYTYSPFDEPDDSAFDVTVGNESVNSSDVRLVSNTQRQYTLVVNPPNQSANGQYDLNVSFTDEKFGVDGTATTSLDDGVSYSGSGASGAASVVLVLDESGSMGYEDAISPPIKMERAKTAANQFLDQFGPNDRISIVSFDSDSTVRSEMMLFGGNESDIRDSIDTITDGGGTDIPIGMEDGLSELSRSPNQTDQATIIMTDGEDSDARDPYSGPGVIDVSNQHSARGHCVYTVGFGSDADTGLLEDIADENCGGFRDTTDAGTDIGDIYRDLSTTTGGLVTFNKTTGNVSAGNSTNQSVPIDNTTDSTVLSVTTGSAASSSAVQTDTDSSLVRSATDGSVDVLLYYPDGTRVQLNESTSSGTENPNIVYTNTGDTQTYRINSPQSGDWSYEVNNTGSSSTEFSTDVSGSTQTTLTVVTDGERYVNGSTADLSAVLVGDDGGISGASATATVEAPDGSTQRVPLTEGSSTGQYTANVSLSQDGAYSATIAVSKGNVDRQKTLSWTVIDESSLLNINTTNRTTVTEGGSASIPINITRPSLSAQSATSQQSQQSGQSAFDSQARELAAMPTEKIHNANVSEELREAALQLREQNTDTESESAPSTRSTDTLAASSTGSGNAMSVYLQTSALTGQNETISASDVQANVTALSLESGRSSNIGVTVSVPYGTQKGVYNGTVTAIVDGTKIQTPISLNVSSADQSAHQTQIITTVAEWESASPSGKTYYEGRIADTLTDSYFGTNEPSQQNTTSAVTSPAEQIQNEGGA